MVASAPSRPPSRIESERSLVDLTHERAPISNAQGLSKAQQEEQEFQQAITNSMSDMHGQQSGVTGVGQQFGPAMRDHYDESWSLVPTSAAREVMNQPAPQDRKRKPGEPAFLRPLPSQDRLPSLLTIYHSIPLARETLMTQEVTTPRYGFDNQWWNGHTITVPKVLAYGEDRRWEDVLFEVQRLMAFLEGTSRAYGSADALANLEQYRLRESDTELIKFFDCWDQAAMVAEGRNTVSRVFSSTALKHVEGGLDRGAKKDFYCLEPPLFETEKTMNDVLDRVIWDDEPESLDTGFGDTFIAKLGEVFTAQFSSKIAAGNGCGISLPAVWYPDRYLSDFRKEALDMRRRAQIERRHVEKVDHRIEQVLKHRLGSGKLVDARETISKAITAAEIVGKDKIPNGVQEELVITDEGTAEVSAAETSKCASELRAIIERIDRKLEGLLLVLDQKGSLLTPIALNTEKQQAIDAYENIMSELTAPSPHSIRSPTHRYTLRGVSTLPHVTYFRQPSSDVRPSSEEAVNDEWDWWRVSFSIEDGQLQQQEKNAAAGISASNTNDQSGQSGFPASQLLSKPENDELIGYTLKKMTESDVLAAAETESKSVLVVYASDTAVNFQGNPVNQHLQAFVNADNETFASELKENDGNGDFEMISNRSSTTLAGQYKLDGGDSDLEPLIERQGESSPVRTMRRGGDDNETLPSPKRSKGSEPHLPSPPLYDNAAAAAQSFVSAVEKADK